MNFTSLVYLLVLLSCAFSIKIDKCFTENQVKFPDTNLKDAFFHGFINAEMNFANISDVGFVKRIIFIGQVRFENVPVTDIMVKFKTFKKIRIQRIINYENNNYTDIVSTNCNLGFVLDYNSRLGLPYTVENQIVQHAEHCFRRYICNFDPEGHTIGDMIVVRAKKRQIMRHTTSQKTINDGIDIVFNKLGNSLIKANKSIIQLPSFDIKAFLRSFKTSGGSIDILTHLQRIEDFSFLYEGHRYIVGTTIKMTGGSIHVNDVVISVPLSTIHGSLSVNMTGAQISVKIALDYNKEPCEILVDKLTLSISSSAVDYSKIETNIWISIKDVLQLVHGFLVDQLAEFLKTKIQELNCEEYRNLLFG